MLTFTLLIGLVYPDGQIREVRAAEGLSFASCQAIMPKVAFQLAATLTRASIDKMECRKELVI